jgi:hypothetical protein
VTGQATDYLITIVCPAPAAAGPQPQPVDKRVTRILQRSAKI